MAKNTDIANVVNEETLAALQESYPVERSSNRIQLPRIGMFSQDKTEKNGKDVKLIQEAGTFYIERETEELNENGKKVWAKEELGATIEGTILYKRNQLKYYDESTEQFTSSPVYDNENEVIPLWCDKAKVAEGTPAELKKLYEYEEDGKTKSKLEDIRVLYLQYKGDVYQMNLRGSSMYSFMQYARKTFVPSVITKFGSTAESKGSISWNKMSFAPIRKITQEEADDVLAKVTEIKNFIAAEKQQFTPKEAELDLNKIF